MKYSWLYAFSICFAGLVFTSGVPAAAPIGDGHGGISATGAAPASGTQAPLPAVAAAEIKDNRAAQPPIPGVKPGNRKANYLVVGSFRRMGDADRLAMRLTAVPAAVTLAVVEENVFFRVVTGPFAGDEMMSARDELTASGIVESWEISLCTADLSAPPCIAP
jgi:hypothetical protein